MTISADWYDLGIHVFEWGQNPDVPTVRKRLEQRGHGRGPNPQYGKPPISEGDRVRPEPGPGPGQVYAGYGPDSSQITLDGRTWAVQTLPALPTLMGAQARPKPETVAAWHVDHGILTGL